MLRTIGSEVWAFDAEWIPDPNAGRLLYDLPAKTADAKVMKEMWQQNGATEEDPTPYLKTILCRVVSISMIARKVKRDGAAVSLHTLPKDISDKSGSSERSIISQFLDGLGKNRPQLVGFNSVNSDLRILVQRGLVLGIHAQAFAARPNKPWAGYDSFISSGEGDIELL